VAGGRHEKRWKVVSEGCAEGRFGGHTHLSTEWPHRIVSWFISMCEGRREGRRHKGHERRPRVCPRGGGVEGGVGTWLTMRKNAVAACAWVTVTRSSFSAVMPDHGVR
jgi:hypothetical protein